MKKDCTFINTVLALSIIVLFAACGSSRKATATYTRVDELNEKLKELTTSGWQVHGSTRTLKGKLAEHYAKMDANPDLREVIGTSNGCRSITVCRAAATNMACVEMAVGMGQELKGKAMRDMGLDESAEMSAEYNSFQEACITKFQATVKGELEESIALIRKETNGQNCYEIYFLVDRKSENKRRVQAIKSALEESNLHQEYARSIEKFINDEE